MYRRPSQAGPIRYQAHTRLLLLAVIVIVVILVPVVLSRAIQLSAELHAARLEVTDDQTWGLAQLEVDYLKLALTVAEVPRLESGDIPEAVMQERMRVIRDRFDIFYSRVGTVASTFPASAEAPGHWEKSLRLLQRVNYRTDLLAKTLDTPPETDAKVWFGALETDIVGIGKDVRDLSVTTLANLSAQATEQRLQYISEQRALLIQSVTMVVVMGVISLLALFLYHQLGVRVAAERRLGENLDRVFDASPNAILIMDDNYQVLWKNRAAAELLGVKPAAVEEPQPLDNYFPGLSRTARNGRTHPLNRSGPSNKFRDIVRRTDGNTVAVEVTRISLVPENGQSTNALFFRDISETQRALRALRRERRLAETEAGRYQRFLAVMSHEIRSPLHAIMVALDLARQRPGASSLADLHDIATDAARMVLREADAVLEIGRTEHEMHAAERVPFSPSEIVASLVEMYGPAANRVGNKFAVEIEPGTEGSVLGLRACFWHAVGNLLSNAVKFTQQGTITLHLERSKDLLRVEVTDTGPGIAPELQALIFRDHYTHDPGTATLSKGAGLGLGLFVEAVRAMEGQYGVESELGKGTTFWFTFEAPSAGLPSTVDAARFPTSDELRTDLSILVVDDSDVNLSLMHQMFAMLGLQADLAESGSEAVKRAQSFGYDVILMDLSMPQMDGYAAASEIRRAGASKRAAIVALTANALARHQVDKPGSGFNGFLLKPLRLDELRTWLAADLHIQSVPQTSLLPIIDRDIAQDLLDMLPASKIESLLNALFNETQDVVPRLDHGFGDEDIAVKFHKIAGSAGMLAATRLRELSLEGEAAARNTSQGFSPAFRMIFRQTISETARDWALVLRNGSTAATVERSG